MFSKICFWDTISRTTNMELRWQLVCWSKYVTHRLQKQEIWKQAFSLQFSHSCLSKGSFKREVETETETSLVSGSSSRSSKSSQRSTLVNSELCCMVVAPKTVIVTEYYKKQINPVTHPKPMYLLVMLPLNMQQYNILLFSDHSCKYYYGVCQPTLCLYLSTIMT